MDHDSRTYLGWKDSRAVRNHLKYVIFKPCLKHLSQVYAKYGFEIHHLSNGNFLSLVMVLPAGILRNKFSPQDLLYF